MKVARMVQRKWMRYPNDVAEATLADNNGGAGWDDGWRKVLSGDGAVLSGSLTYNDGALDLPTQGNRAVLSSGDVLARDLDLEEDIRHSTGLDRVYNSGWKPRRYGHINLVCVHWSVQ